MIPFEELVAALDRFQRRKSGQAAPQAQAAQQATVSPRALQSSGRARDASLEFSLDDVEEA